MSLAGCSGDLVLRDIAADDPCVCHILQPAGNTDHTSDNAAN